ncbi:MAG: hypothetical protein KGZ39_01395 [Simkania sp.]|nr:hypothetical protein [Simkania sp.]
MTMLCSLVQDPLSSSLPLSLEEETSSNTIKVLEGFSHDLESDFLETYTKKLLLEFFDPLQKSLSDYLEDDSLPIVKTILPEQAPGVLRVLLVCEGTRFTSGSGRHMLELFNRWLIPGKPMTIPSLYGINFVLSTRPDKKLFLCHLMISIESLYDLQGAREGISELVSILKKNISAVCYVRKLLEKTSMNSSQQQAFFAEYLSSLQTPSTPEFDQNLYEYTSEFFHKAQAEKKITEVRQHVEHLFKNRRAFFDQDIFSEIYYFVWLYRSCFIGKKDRTLLTKLISLQYLFRKYLRQKIEEAPQIRHVTFKIFPLRPLSTHVSSLGLLIGITLLKEGELFEEKHVLRAVEQLVPGIRLIPKTFIQDSRNAQKFRLIYLEIEKTNETPFSSSEISCLRRQLPHELKVCVETLIHPLFMPRNDEDLLRFSLQLCGQLNDLTAPPQMAIFFGNQTSETLSFTVLLARLLYPTPPLPLFKQLEQSGAFFEVEDIEIRYPPSKDRELALAKEMISFTAKIPKAPFLRSDYTIDVIQARQEIVRQMQEALGFVRDYNGGLLETQLRAEQLFLISLGTLGNRDLLLAKAFFHAITPPLMQVILETSLLKKIFLMFLEVSTGSSPSLTSYSAKRYECFLIKSSSSCKKDISRILKELAIPTTQITSAELEFGGSRFFALIHQNEGHQNHVLMLSLQELLQCVS